MDTFDKVEWLLKYYSQNPSHTAMYDERVEKTSCFKIDLGIDTYIINNFDNSKVILLTGDAGDGKTRIISTLRERLGIVVHKKVFFYEDFSQLSNIEQKYLFDRIDESIATSKLETYVIAANSGIFTSAMIKYKGELKKKLEHSNQFIEINFNKRNLARRRSNEDIEETLFYKIVSTFLEGNYSCTKQCGFKDKFDGLCPFEYNIRNLSKGKVIESLRVLFHCMYLIGVHVTFRELLSAISYFVTGGYSCNEVNSHISECNNISEFLFFNNVFNFKVRGNDQHYNFDDRILLKLSDLDISQKDFRELDFKIFNNVMGAEGLGLEENEKLLFARNLHFGAELKYKPNVEERLDLLKNIKRYLYFTHPDKLCDNNNLILAIPLEFIGEFKEILNILGSDSNEEVSNFNTNLPSVISDFELGMNRLSVYNSTSSLFEVYDSPPMVGRNIRLKYNIDEDDVELVYKAGLDDVNNVDAELLNYDYNTFQIVAYNGEQYLSTLNVDYDLFNQVFMAKDRVYKPHNSEISCNNRLDSFRNEMVQNIDIKKSIIVTWSNSEQNFKIGLIKNQRKGTSHVSINL